MIYTSQSVQPARSSASLKITRSRSRDRFASVSYISMADLYATNLKASAQGIADQIDADILNDFTILLNYNKYAVPPYPKLMK